MKTSQTGLNLIESFEGKRNKAYFDQVGILTCGIGTTNAVLPVGSKITITTVWTDAECYQWLAYAIHNSVEVPMTQLIKVGLSQNQFDAIACLVYNIGIPNFASSTLLKYLNAGRFDLVQREFLKWDRAGNIEVRGLLRRRLAEAVLFGGRSRDDLIKLYLNGISPDIKP